MHEFDKEKGDESLVVVKVLLVFSEGLSFSLKINNLVLFANLSFGNTC